MRTTYCVAAFGWRTQVPPADCILVGRCYKGTAVVQVPATRIKWARWISRCFDRGPHCAYQRKAHARSCCVAVGGG